MLTRQRNGGVISRAREGTRASRAFIEIDAHHPQKLRSPIRCLGNSRFLPLGGRIRQSPAVFDFGVICSRLSLEDRSRKRKPSSTRN
jgi:hypothetical protein